MPTLVLFLFRFARFLFSGHAALAVENAALRLQLDAFRRKCQRPVLTSFDRLFWVASASKKNGRFLIGLMHCETVAYAVRGASGRVT